MDIKDTKLYRENIGKQADLFKDIFKNTNLLQRINNLSFGDSVKQKNNKFCFVFSVCYVINHNLENEINPRTIKKLFSIVKKELDNLIQKTIINQKPIKKELDSDKFNKTINREELGKERVYLNLVIENDGTPENEFRILRQKYFELEQERYEIILFKVLFDNLEEISPSVDKNANRLLYDVFKQVDGYRDSVKVDVFSNNIKDDLDNITLYNAGDVEKVFKLNTVVLYKDDSKSLEIINNYKNNVEEPLNNLDTLLANAKDKKSQEEIISKLQEKSKNVVKNRGKYYLLQSEKYNTIINVDLEGLYYITSNEGQRIARLPSSIIVNKSNALFVLDKLISLALKDPYKPRIELDFSNRDIAEFTNCLEEFEKLKDNNLTPKEREALYNKVYYSKDEFIKKITEQLFYIRIDSKDLNTNILDFKSKGAFFEEGIIIIFRKDYLLFRYKEGYIGEFNSYILEEFKTNLNAVRIYEGITKTIYREILEKGDYNYIFTLKQLRAFGGYVSEDFLSENITNYKERNKRIQETIRSDLLALKERNFILISQIKSKKEFTIMLNNRPMKELLELFNKQCEKNGHALIIDN